MIYMRWINTLNVTVLFLFSLIFVISSSLIMGTIKFFCRKDDQQKSIMSYLHWEPSLEVFNITFLRNTARKIWTCTKTKLWTYCGCGIVITTMLSIHHLSYLFISYLSFSGFDSSENCNVVKCISSMFVLKSF